MRYIVPVFCLIFGLMTFKEGGSVLFVDGEARQAAGNYVPWVLWFNFLTGFALIAMGVASLMKKSWTPRLAFSVAGLSAVILVALLIHIAMGGSYETRTLVAMPIRTAIWAGLAFWSIRKWPNAFA